MYHYISVPPPDADRYRLDLSVTPENMDAQMGWLAENGYATITLQELLYHLTLGWPLPERPVVLTFDDGYRDAFENAFPILQKYGFVGTFFIITDRVTFGEPAYATWDQIVEMHNAGMDIQSHTRTHPDLRGLVPGKHLRREWTSRSAFSATPPVDTTPTLFAPCSSMATGRLLRPSMAQRTRPRICLP
jgi:peptidoglycan/xylan/chitin deacetylase (PgdA/CDA1 family)